MGNVVRPPTVNLLKKIQEGSRLTYTRCKVTLEDLKSDQQPISQAGIFNHHYVYPLYNLKGKNERVNLGGWAAEIAVQDGSGKIQKAVQAASHNYAGFYKATPESEELQRLVLDNLPVSDSHAVPSLEEVMHQGIARLFAADFCYTISTGYGSNLLALSAILDPNWMIILDDKCHNSMYVAAYMSHAGLVRKYCHGNMRQLETILAENRPKFAHILVAVEGFYRLVYKLGNFVLLR